MLVDWIDRTLKHKCIKIPSYWYLDTYRQNSELHVSDASPLFVYHIHNSHLNSDLYIWLISSRNAVPKQMTTFVALELISPMQLMLVLKLQHMNSHLKHNAIFYRQLHSARISWNSMKRILLWICARRFEFWTQSDIMRLAFRLPTLSIL